METPPTLFLKAIFPVFKLPGKNCFQKFPGLWHRPLVWSSNFLSVSCFVIRENPFFGVISVGQISGKSGDGCCDRLIWSWLSRFVSIAIGHFLDFFYLRKWLSKEKENESTPTAQTTCFSLGEAIDHQTQLNIHSEYHQHHNSNNRTINQRVGWPHALPAETS